jgi:tetratricopeptide (TPR) repeat protein
MTAPDIEAAVARHRAGELEAAEQGYLAVLAAEPHHPRALHNLGVILLRRRETDRALSMLGAAHRASPTDFPPWAGYGQALISAERFQEAEALLAPYAGEPQAAPFQLRLQQAWGMALMAQNRLSDAETRFRSAVALAPEQSDTHADLGLLLLRQERAAEARESLNRALALAPDDVGARVNLGTALRALGDAEGAEAAYRAALHLEPGHAAAIDNLVILLRDQSARLDTEGRYEEALTVYDADEGEEVDFRRQALTLKGVKLAGDGRFPEAILAYGEAMKLRPDWSVPYYLRSFSRLVLCDFERGWQDYECRLDVQKFIEDSGVLTPGIVQRLVRRPAVDAFDGKHVLVVAEQGIGDQVMFASMIPDLLPRVAGLTCAVEARLIRLFQSSFPGVRLMQVPGTMSLSGIDQLVAMGSLGHAFRRKLSDFPGAPYLKPSGAAQRRWAERLGPASRRLRVGISWRGGTPRTRAEERSLTLDQLTPVLGAPGCEFVSLQYGDIASEVAEFTARTGHAIRVFPREEIDDFDDLAGLVSNLDIVVSVQTALVHLTGAIGKPCLTMLPQFPEWRYTLAARTMPWYPSVQLLRQPDRGDWEPVIERVAKALRERDLSPA